MERNTNNVDYVVAGWEETRRLVQATGGLVVELFEAVESDPEATFDEMEAVTSMLDITGHVAGCVREMLEDLQWPGEYASTVIAYLDQANSLMQVAKSAHEQTDGIPPHTRTRWNFIRVGHIVDFLNAVTKTGAASARSEVEFASRTHMGLDILVKDAQSHAEANDFDTQRILELGEAYLHKEGMNPWKL